MVNSHRGIAAAAALVGSLLSSGACAETFTLDQALAVAYQNNFRLQAARADLRATDEDVSKALSTWRPYASASGSYGIDRDHTNNPFFAPGEHPRDYGVTVTQPIYNPQTIPQTEEAKANVRAGRAGLTSIEEQVLLDAATSYFDVVQGEQVVAIERDNASLLDRQLHDMQTRFARHDVTKTDVSLTQSRLSSANSDVQLTAARLQASRAAFEQLIGRPAETLESDAPLPATNANEEAALGEALSTNADLRSAKEQVKAADKAVDAAYAEMLPSLVAQGQYKISKDELARGITDTSLTATAQLRVPLYQGGGEQADIRKAKEVHTRALMQMHDIEARVRQDVHTAWQARDASLRAVELEQQQVAESEDAYQGTDEEVKAGERTTFDLLNASQERLGARLALANAKHDLAVSTFRLLQATGGLTAVALKLPVKLYDPVEHYEDDAGRWFGFGD
jgi:TolC family type I secretion outer membrane protein